MDLQVGNGTWRFDAVVSLPFFPFLKLNQKAYFGRNSRNLQKKLNQLKKKIVSSKYEFVSR